MIYTLALGGVAAQFLSTCLHFPGVGGFLRSAYIQHHWRFCFTLSIHRTHHLHWAALVRSEHLHISLHIFAYHAPR